MVVHICNPVLLREKWEDLKFKVILCYIVNFKTGWQEQNKVKFIYMHIHTHIYIHKIWGESALGKLLAIHHRNLNSDSPEPWKGWAWKQAFDYHPRYGGAEIVGSQELENLLVYTGPLAPNSEKSLSQKIKMRCIRKRHHTLTYDVYKYTHTHMQINKSTCTYIHCLSPSNQMKSKYFLYKGQIWNVIIDMVWWFEQEQPPQANWFEYLVP